MGASIYLQAYLLSEDSSGSGGGGDSSIPSQAAGTAVAAAGATAPAGGSSGSSSTGGGGGGNTAPPAAVPTEGGRPASLLDLEPASWLKRLDSLEFPPPAKAALLVATGAVAGVASGLLGVGGGLIVTPLLAMTMPYSQATVLGTSLLSMIPPATAALVQHRR